MSPLPTPKVKLAANVRMKAFNKSRKEEGIEDVSLGVFPLQEKLGGPGALLSADWLNLKQDVTWNL